MKILRVVVIRTLLLVPSLLGLVTIMFLLTYYIPADPLAVAAGEFATPEQKEKIRQLYGFDKPISVQYIYYIKNIVIKGDFGRSLYSQGEIRNDIAQRLPATLELSLLSLFFGLVLGTLLGVYSAINRNNLTDHLIRGITIAGISFASFWVAIELQLIFSYKLDILPLFGRIDISLEPPPFVTGFYLIDSAVTLNWKAFLSSLSHLLLPGITLALVPIGTIARFARSGTLGVLDRGYIAYGRAMGVSEGLLIWKYGLKNALVGTIAQSGLLFGFVLASTFVVEKIFMWPGIGSYALDSILYLDYKAVFAVSLWAGVVFSIGNLLGDIGLLLIDPREIAK
jgi:peptide/nickel transport system permease protein